jgi:hypothetical protein
MNEKATIAVAAMTAEQAAAASLRLPEFWPDTPAACFVYMESKFRLKNIQCEAVKFDVLVGSLPRDAIRRVLEVVERPDEEAPYTSLKDRLLSLHELTDFQRIEKLFQMEPLGGRKPSDLMNQMLEICPRGEKKNKFFLFLFLQRLPKELRVMLTEEDLKEPRDLASKAGRHWAMLAHQTHGMLANLAAEDETDASGVIAAAHYGGRGHQNRGRGGRGRGRDGGGRDGIGRAGTSNATQQHQQDGQSVNTPPHPTAPGFLARFSTGLCHFHWTFGDRARRCETPCPWGPIVHT